MCDDIYTLPKQKTENDMAELGAMLSTTLASDSTRKLPNDGATEVQRLLQDAGCDPVKTTKGETTIIAYNAPDGSVWMLETWKTMERQT